MDLNALATEIQRLVASSPALQAALGENYLYLGVAETFPAITINGISAIDAKERQHSFLLNLIILKSTGTFDEAALFYTLADQLKVALNASLLITSDAWVDRGEPGFYRALFLCEA